MLFVVAPPDPVVSLAQAKRQLRIDAADTDDDVLITDLVAVATASLDGPGGWLGRALGPQILELRTAVPWGGDCIDLPCPPLLAVVAVTYADRSGAAQTMEPTSYALAGNGLTLAAGQSWPATLDRPDALRVTYRAGYAPTAEAPPRSTVPMPVQHAILMMVTDLYETRDAKMAANLVENPALRNLLGPYRIFG